MTSPNFKLRRTELESAFQVRNIRETWKKKVRSDLKSQLLFDLFEYIDFHTEIDSRAKSLRDSFLEGAYTPASGVRVAVEKSKGLCRHLSVPNANDALALQVLSDRIYPALKNASPTKSAYFERKDFSFKRVSGANLEDGYGTFKSWLQFQDAIFNFSQKYNYIITTDVANFYDFIGHRHLRNIVTSISNHPEVTLDALIHTLSGLLWHPDYMPRVEIGLPQIDGDAPRILAHSFLYEADEFLGSIPGTEFARFMDDIDIGANSIPECKDILKKLDIVLKKRQLRLNSGKTKILHSTDAAAHFWVKENFRLDQVEAHIERAPHKFHKGSRACNLLCAYLRRGYQKHKFALGNGEKILMRLFSLLGKARAPAPDFIIEDVLKNRPGVRKSVFNHLRQVGLKRRYLRISSTLLCEGYWNDDASCHHLAKYVVESRYRTNSINLNIIKSISEFMIKSDSSSRFISGLWIASKFFDPPELFAMAKREQDRWSNEPTLGRLVGGLMLRMKVGSVLAQKFQELILQSLSRPAIDALRFSRQLSEENGPIKATFGILKQPNPSYPNKITHSKMLMVLATLANIKVDDTQKVALQTAHSTALSDKRYEIIENELK